MYLKSLVLKGFKSFADRSVLSLQPGITAIVGPNGSGKSNISDAVLWVLGERNARNLRGQAMEDIIFSGSAARKAVSVAEVDLVLDNSDKTLPVEFDEVVITRRMFRSGESEYLVNGVVARRLDVLDILHDTGLGTGTHSIISQGSLDLILRSRPEDRRALIEEAAGVLKHKQRKEKSAKKLAAMDAHLVRIRDIVAEVERQIGPLERKAKRAVAFKQASEELSQYKLVLAVDDLRGLQLEWDKVCAAEAQAQQELASKRAQVDAAERKVNDFQEIMRRESQDAGVIARRQRRASNLVDKLDNVETVLRERRRSNRGYVADMRVALEESASRRTTAELDLKAAVSQFEEVGAEYDSAQKKAAALEEQHRATNAKRSASEVQLSAIEEKARENDASIEEGKRRLAVMNESLSSGIAQEKIVKARLADMEESLKAVQAERAQAAQAFQAAADELSNLEKREREARDNTAKRFDEREEARLARDAAVQAVHVVEAQKRAVQLSLAEMREQDPALNWLLSRADSYPGSLQQVSQSIRASANLEDLVEHLLGEDIASLAVKDKSVAASVAAALAGEGVLGDVSVVMRKSNRNSAVAAARAESLGYALVDKLRYGKELADVVEALLGDVVVCKTRDEALSAHATSTEALRFASEDGCVVWPSGKVRIFGKRAERDEGVLARERRIDELTDSLRDAKEKQNACEKAVTKADEQYREAQKASLKLSQELANQRGVHAAAQSDDERAEKRLQDAKREQEDMQRQVSEAMRAVADLRPDVEALEARISEMELVKAQLAVKRETLQDDVAPLREQATQLAESLSEAKLNAATLRERKTYSERMVATRKQAIAAIDNSVEDNKRVVLLKTAAARRADALMSVLNILQEGLSARTRVLDDALAASEDATNDVHKNAAQARDEARAAHATYDEASSRMTQVRVDKSRLEVKVEAALNVVVKDCHCPLDHAQELPPLENRPQVEDDVFRLQRRIRNMGSVNPDAVEEYEQLKERFDYLTSQLEDMESARRSLTKVVRVIDERMRDDFINTYQQVNDNFSEIFSLLFPGGQAHLSFEDPDDIEHTGVEVTAQPRGKRLTKMMLMSGGEKSLTALALLFAVYRTRTTPFYILDEVEAALDDTNLRRLTSYIDSLRSSTQLIMITHQRRTMEMADVLFGVTMKADGVTKVISQKLERALEQAE